jgi:CTP:molybdopterin cytidylyltransferase MocA
MDRAVTAWCVVLAAGRGERLGGVAKALLRAGDRSFLRAVHDTARAGGVARVVVVIGPPFGDAVAAEAGALGAEIVVNPDPGRGMASSVALGFAHVIGRGDEALLWPVDHPHVAARTVVALREAVADVVVPRFGGRGGHPALVSAAVWPALAACPPGGAREVLADPRFRRIDLEVDDPGVVRDVDTPEALRS